MNIAAFDLDSLQHIVATGTSIINSLTDGVLAVEQEDTSCTICECTW